MLAGCLLTFPAFIIISYAERRLALMKAGGVGRQGFKFVRVRTS